MKDLYEIVEIDERGFRAIQLLAMIEANSEKEAKEIAAKYLKNPEIITTGFYAARKLSRTKWLKKIKNAHNKLSILKNILN